MRRDRGGRTYTDREFDSILPTFYARQLLNDERFPDSLCGVAVTPRLLQSENFMFRSTPGGDQQTPYGALSAVGIDVGARRSGDAR